MSHGNKLKGARTMQEYLWIRLGDQGDYEKLEGIEQAAELLTGCSNEIVKCNYYGVSDNDIYAGNNYVSLFYGNEDVQPTKPISYIELQKLNELIRNKLTN